MAYSKKTIKTNYDLFIKKCARKKQKHGSDPNDRHYDRKFEKIVKRMKPEDLYILLEDEDYYS